jgi:hypothetical protein
VVRPKITELQQAAPLRVISQRTTMRMWSDHGEQGDGRSRVDIFLVFTNHVLSMPLAYPSALDRFARPTWRGFVARRSHVDRKSAS